MRSKIRVADLFCGAGGTSSGLMAAAEGANIKVDLLAVNHWQIAVATHAKNHPKARHLHSSLDSVDAKKVVDTGKLDILVASPECTHHSTARGGKPMNDQSRSSAWHVLSWAQSVAPEYIIVENVPEFMTWGPLGRNGRPIESRKGETFRAWAESLRSMGYVVEWRILNAADYGDPTTRRRLFVLARKGRRPPRWPDPTHGDPKKQAGLFTGNLLPWRSARESVIDWNLKGSSIFNRKKPLADATLRRIAEGLRRFGGAAAEPFLAILRGTSSVRSVDQPVPTLTSGGGHVALIEPFMLKQSSGGAPRSVNDPISTVQAAGAISLVEPYLVPFYGERRGQAPRTHSAADPLPTIPATAAKFGLVEPFLVHANHGGGDNRRVQSVDRPMPTVTTSRGLGLAQPFILAPLGVGRGNAPRGVDSPMPTILASRGGGHLVEHAGIDVLFRMLQPHELAAAMGFPASYEFTGNRTEQVRQIGNAVPVGVATALCRAAIESL